MSTLSRDFAEAREREGRAKEEVLALRGKASTLEDQAALASREAEEEERSLRAEVKVIKAIAAGAYILARVRRCSWCTAVSWSLYLTLV